MANSESKTSITWLPDEIITLILAYNKPRDIIKFALTCKDFYGIVIGNDYLWKIKYSEIVSQEMVKIVEQYCNSNWIKELTQYYNLKRQIYNELVSMSPKFYMRLNDVSLEDLRYFFEIATESNLSYYYTIHILQNLVTKGNIYLDKLTALKPYYTLTVVYYSKIVLRHLVQTYLSIKWVQLHMKQILTPEVVITFFLQWIDPTTIYKDEDVDSKIQTLVTKVQNILKDTYSKKSKGTDVKYSEKKILLAISHAIYKRENFSLHPNTKVKTLDITKVIDESNGNIITYAVIFHAVARRLGVDCRLIAFPNHLFLEWQNLEEPNKPLYTVDLTTGDINPKRRCPFSPGSDNNYEYFPDSLIQYVYSSYMKSKGAIRDCKTQNAIHLLDFLGTRNINHNPYENFYPYLVENADRSTIHTPLDMKYLQNIYLDMVKALTNLNYPEEPSYNNIVVKKHRSTVTYAVGMICYHKIYNYMCVIRDWDLDGKQLCVPVDDNLHFGREQPYYRVIAGDQSERLIAQENLMAVTTPFRIQRLEDHIGREFTHFDGFSYVPNDEKTTEYPGEQQVTEMFRKRFLNLAATSSVS